MYIVYYDCGTTNTRAYLLNEGVIRQSISEKVGIKDFALEQDKSGLVKKLHEIFGYLIKTEKLNENNIAEIWLSGMISSPSGLIEIEHITAPVSLEKLKSSIAEYYEPKLFNRTLKIVPGIKTLNQGEKVLPEKAPEINIMRGEEIEIFGVLRENPELKTGCCVLVLPGSHTHAVLIQNGIIQDISSNVTGELFSAILDGTILGASITGKESWEISGEMVRLGAEEVHRAGFNKALYTLRTMDLFTSATLNERRSYLEGVLNAGVMDSISCMAKNNNIKDNIRLAVAGDNVQKEVFNALSELYSGFNAIEIKKIDAVPYSVKGILSIALV